MNNLDLESKITKLASMVRESNNTIVLTGAGMDTESNIPDFRSKSGWWRNIDPLSVATTEALKNNYDLFHEFYSYRLRRFTGIKPHEGHYVLARLEEQGFISCIATQNVSGLHKQSGSKEVYELHGNINKIKCNDCNNGVNLDEFLEKNRCNNCESMYLRPGVTLFGETLPEDAWNSTIHNMENADLMIVIGTSLAVYPVNEIPKMFNGVKVYINNEECINYNDFDLTIIGKAKDILSRLELLVLQLWKK